MRLSIWPNPSQPWDVIVEQVCALERDGWDGVYFADHFMPNFGDVTGPTGECVAIMGGSRRRRSACGIGSLVFGNTYRHPAVLANQVATDRPHQRRPRAARLGAGWQENEHEAYGIELPPREASASTGSRRRPGRARAAPARSAFSFERRVLRDRRGAARTQAGADMRPARRRRRREADDAHRRAVRRRVERVVDARDHAPARSTCSTATATTSAATRRHQRLDPGAAVHERRRVVPRRHAQGRDADADDDRHAERCADILGRVRRGSAWTSSSSPTSPSARRGRAARRRSQGLRSLLRPIAARRLAQAIGTTGLASSSSWWRYSLIPVPVRPS